MMRTRMPQEQTMTVTVIAPKRVSESWWVGIAREHFTERARQRQFSSAPRRGDRIRTIAEEIAAASRIAD